MDHNTPDPKAAAETLNEGSTRPKSSSRRALIKAGAAATPVLLTLASGPVAATGSVNCVVASSFVSTNTFKSRNGTSANCTSKNCDYWQAQCGSTMSSCSNTWLKRKVRDVVGSNSSCAYNDTYCWNVMKATITQSGELGFMQHLLALVMAAESGQVNTTNPQGGTFNKAYLVSVYGNYYANGKRFKLPSTNAVWTDQELIAWLRVMQGYTLI